MIICSKALGYKCYRYPPISYCLTQTCIQPNGMKIDHTNKYVVFTKTNENLQYPIFRLCNRNLLFVRSALSVLGSIVDDCRAPTYWGNSVNN